MSQCAIIQPDQTLKFTPDDAQGCSGYLLLTPQEVASLQSPFPPLSVTDGLMISGAILGLWALAWLWSLIGNFTSSTSGESQ
ncbi:hypothetical protein AAFM71_01160 [Chromobacterium violaceum]|uniref:hypothetical protein n=1 Tax=Chromobacterium violaceum TaxID=536 RepID=UPI00385B4151